MARELLCDIDDKWSEDRRELLMQDRHDNDNDEHQDYWSCRKSGIWGVVPIASHGVYANVEILGNFDGTIFCHP